MRELKYTWKNFGIMRFGYDIAKIKVVMKNTGKEKFNIYIDTTKIEISDKMYNELNPDKAINIKEVFEKLEKVNFPEEKKYETKGCDGFAWELEVDDKKYEGYLVEPEFLKQVLQIIHFEDIFSYSKQKIKNYLK